MITITDNNGGGGGGGGGMLCPVHTGMGTQLKRDK